MPSPTTRTYEDWMAANNAQPRASTASLRQGGQTTIGGTSRTAPGAQGWVYTPGQSNDSFVRDNVRSEFSLQNPFQGYASVHSPVAAITRGVRGYKAFKKSQAAERFEQDQLDQIHRRAQAAAPTSWLNTFDPTSRTAQEAYSRAGDRPMTADEIELGLRQEGQERTRAGQTQDVENYFGSPERSQWQAGIVGNRLNANLGRIGEEFESNTNRAVQGSAAQGLVGGSVDMERRGGVERARDTSAIGAASQADSDLLNFKQQDADSRRQLLGLVNSGGFADSAAFSDALRGINDATNRSAQQYQLGQQRQELDQFGRQQQSQAIGQGFNNLASIFRQDPYRSSSTSAWTGSTSTGGW